MTEYTIIREFLASEGTEDHEVEDSDELETFCDEDEARDKAVLLNTENEDQNVRFCIRAETFRKGMFTGLYYIEHDEL